MEFNLSSLMTLLTLCVSIGMPRLIAFVAKSSNRTVNLLISYGSSAVLGILTALAGGDFGSDLLLNVTVAITATQTAYNAYWKDRLSA